MKKAVTVFILLSVLGFIMLAPLPAKASVPQWRILWIILPRLNVTHNGTNFTSRLTAEEIAKIREMSERTERFIETASNNAVDIKMTIIESTRIVTSLTEDDAWLYVGEDDFPSDIKQELSRAKEAENPYHLKVATFRLDGEGDKLGWAGLGGGTYARARFFNISDYEESPTRPHPEEVWIHELLHCFEGIFSNLGYTMAGLHDNAKYGYVDDNGWYKWYEDILAGKIQDPSTGTLIGIKNFMWQYQPGETQNHDGHTYQVCNREMLWNDAKEYCEALGGHLVTITSGTEQNYVEKLLKGAEQKYPVYWIGAINDNGWEWVTGESFAYRKFDDNQPDGSGAYLQLYTWGGNFGFWDDTISDKLENIWSHGFICEWDFERGELATTPTITTSTLPEGTIGEKYTKKLYAAGITPVKWSAVGLPDNFVCTTSGIIKGTPRSSGTYNIMVTVTNSEGEDSKDLVFVVNSSPVSPEPEEEEEDDDDDSNNGSDFDNNNDNPNPHNHNNSRRSSSGGGGCSVSGFDVLALLFAVSLTLKRH